MNTQDGLILWMRHDIFMLPVAASPFGRFLSEAKLLYLMASACSLCSVCLV